LAFNIEVKVKVATLRFGEFFDLPKPGGGGEVNPPRIGF
jgi:hypothetical protein